MIIEKNNKRSINYIWLLVYYCKFIVMLYRCYEIVLVSIIIWFQTKGK